LTERVGTDMPDKNGKSRFESIPQDDVPRGRDGKHKHIVVELLQSLEELHKGAALKIALTDLPDSKENIRAALSRATRQRNLNVATSSDDDHLYIWKTDR
jgi:TusA-related sulfurtransferase